VEQPVTKSCRGATIQREQIEAAPKNKQPSNGGVVVAWGRAIQGRKAILGGDKQMFGAK
jgi:hypothetical protein